MGMYLNPGNGMFQDTLNGDFYVDKTGLASFMNARLNTPQKFVCVSRPRRFGKSVDADMLVAYYGKGTDSRAQFEGLSVSRDPSFERHLNAHDVIKIDVQRIRDLSGGSSSGADIAATVMNQVVPDIQKRWPDAVPEGCHDLPLALELVYMREKAGFVFVIDEWDLPMREPSGSWETQKPWLDFLRYLLKDRVYVDAAFMTGVIPIVKCGHHSGLNMFMDYTMASPTNLVSLFGFGEDDVERLCCEFGMDAAEMARWFGGYELGPDGLRVCSPGSVAQALANGKYADDQTCAVDHETLRLCTDIDFDGMANDLVQLVGGARVYASMDLRPDTATDFRCKDDAYAMLVHFGYLGYDCSDRTVFVPNKEMLHQFVDSIRNGSRPELTRLADESGELVRATVEGNAAYVADALDRAHSWAAAPRWYNDEQALRAAVKFAYLAALDDYLRVDELPGGKGFADVVFVPKPGSPLPPMVVELKWDRPVSAALDQIRARNYPAALSGLSGECVLAGVTYDAGTKRHECAIERIEL